MKKLFTYIALFAAVVACQDMYGPEQTPIKPVASEGIDVSVTASADSSVTFTLAPKGESTYYSYLLAEGDKVEALDSTALLSCSYDGVASATFKWTAETPSQTVTVGDLAPNTTYQIYAVAGSSMGIPSAVANTSFKTSDKVAPTLTDYETADSVAVITFDEPVVRGTGQLVAGIYAMNSTEINKGLAIDAINIEEDWIKINGANVEVTVKGLPAGAFYSINYPEGAFTDVSENKVAGLESTVVYGLDTKWEPVYIGVGGRNALVSFTLGQIKDEKFASAVAPVFLLSFDSEYGYGYTSSRKGGMAYYSIGNKITAYKLTPGTDFDYVANYGGVVLPLPTAGEPGNLVEIVIEEGVFEDFFGNFSEAWTDEILYSYGFTLDDVIGDFVCKSPENVSQSVMQYGITIAESNKPEKGNVMITKFADIPCMAPIYGTFNGDYGTLTVAAGQAFYLVTNNNQTPDDPSDDFPVLYVFYTYNNPSVTFSMTEAGKFTAADDYFGVLLAPNGELSNWGYLFLDFEAEKVQATETPAPGAASAVSFADFAYPWTPIKAEINF